MEKFKRISSIIAVLLSIGTIIGLWPTVNGSTDNKPVVQVSAPIEMPAATKYEKEEVVAPKVPELSAKDAKWIYGILESYKLPVLEDVTIAVTDKGNCGSEAGETGTGGGCFYPAFKILMISPEIIRTEAGIVVLLHEYAHATGITDECMAEYFAHDLIDSNLWSYQECADNR